MKIYSFVYITCYNVSSLLKGEVFSRNIENFFIVVRDI